METNIVPDVSDIRAKDYAFNVLNGFEGANRRDRARALTTDAFARGEWVKVGSNGKVSKVAAAADTKASPVFRGTEGYDSYATNQVTLFENPTGMIVQTDNYVAASYANGDLLVAKLVAGKGTLAKSAGGAEDAFAVARVAVVGDGYLELHLL